MLGHEVTVLAPSGRAADLIAGHRALARGENADVIAIGAAVPDLPPLEPRRPGRRARQLAPRAAAGALRRRPRLRARAAEHLRSRAPRRGGARRRQLPLARTAGTRRAAAARAAARAVDALLATSEPTAAAAAERYPGDYRVVPLGVDMELFRPGDEAELVAIELHRAAPSHARRDSRARRAARLGGRAAADEAALDAARVPAGAPRPCARPPGAGPRPRKRARRGGDVRAGPDGLARLRLEALRRGLRDGRAAGCRAARARHGRRGAARGGRRRARAAAQEARAAAEAQSFAALPTSWTGSTGARRRRRTRRREADPLADREWILVDLHMHTLWSHDCSIEVDELIDHAEETVSGRSRSPTTTCSAARSRPPSWRVAAT